MNPNDVIEAYVVDVMRRLPSKERNEIGFELRDLLNEMLAERAGNEGRAADDPMVLAMLREFGTPAEVAARYRAPGMVIIPAEQTRSFALMSIIGLIVQWALSLPRVLEGQPLVAWWFSWGLGAFWWPGFLVMMTLLGTWLRQMPWFKPSWRPRIVDPERVNRTAMAFGLFWFALGVVLMVSLPWIVGRLPDPLPHVFAFDGDFLGRRAWPVVVLWLGLFATEVSVFVMGRPNALTRRLNIAFSLAFFALLSWWLLAGDIFQAQATNAGARGGLGLMLVIIVIELAYRLHRRRPRIRAPEVAQQGKGHARP